WPMAKSIFASTISPGRTDSRPPARARIFSVIVMPTGWSISHTSGDRVARFRSGQAAAQVARALACPDRRRHCVFDPLRNLLETEVSSHHSRARNRPQGIDHAPACDSGGAAVHRLEQAAPGL